MAERQIRRLRTQVKEERSKRLKGRPKKWSPDDEFDSDEDVAQLRQSRNSRNSDIFGATGASKNLGSTIRTDASFRSMTSNFAQSTNLHSSKFEKSLNETLKQTPEELLESSLLSVDSGVRHSMVVSKSVPSFEYLKGALWLGRNIVMQMESLIDKIESFKSQYLREVTSTASDNDVQRACHRLTLLAASRVGELAIAAEAEKTNIRNMIHVMSIYRKKNY
jgi:hypothetical protein